MKKGCLIAAGGVVALLIVVVVVVFQLTGGAADSANQFIAQINSGKLEEAYRSTASALQAGQSLAQFTEGVRALGLDHVQSASWSNRQIEGSQATLEGTGKTDKGGTVPLTAKLVKEGGSWKVVAFNLQTGVGGSGATAVPSTKELDDLVTESLLALNEAVASKDFKAFYDKTAEVWRKQTTPEKLAESFQDLIEKDVKMDGIKDVQPEFSPAPAIDSNGVLIVGGEYPTQPSRVQFTVKYVKESQGWRLIGVRVHVGH